MSASPTLLRLKRFKLRRKSGYAMGEALRQAANSHPFRVDYDRLRNMAMRVANCSFYLRTDLHESAGQPARLLVSNSSACKSRLCPNCEFTRSKKQARLLNRAMELASRERPGLVPLMLTATSRNRPLTVDDTIAMIASHDVGLRRFFRGKRIQSSWLGHYSSIELAVRGTPAAPEIGVHSHSLLLVDAGYFEDDRYLPQREIKRLWKRALRIDYQPIVHINKLRGQNPLEPDGELYRAVLEVTKYLTKPVFAHDGSGGISVDPYVAEVLLRATYRRRFHRYDRIFASALRQARAEFKQQRKQRRAREEALDIPFG